MPSKRPNSTVIKMWQAVVAELSAQNGPIELAPITEAGVALPRIRARLLKADAKDDSLIVEKPSNQPQAEALGKGVAVEAVVITGSTRMKAQSRVIDVGRFSLNKQTKVLAYRLEPMKDIATAQRRACFRLDTAGLAMTAKLRHEAWPESQPTLSMKVLDVSDRGFGVTGPMDIELAEKMKGQVYEVALPLSGSEEKLQLKSRVMRVIETAYQTVTLGFQFEFTTQIEQRRVERVIQQFSVAQQRKQLRRIRGAG